MNRLEFASVLQYPPRLGVVQNDLLSEARTARNLVLQLKGALAGSESTRTADVLANHLRVNDATRSFTTSYFRESTMLVPVPRSTLLTAGGLWPARVLANSLRGAGLGGSVGEILERAKPIRKSATSLGVNRPGVVEKYESLRLVAGLDIPTEVTLIDDVVTTGAEFLAAANRVAEVFRSSRIKAFAAARTMSGPPRWPFSKAVDPISGMIECSNNQAWRSP
ncbi:MAG: hypothetical protein L3K23_06560 [Thermoplasmata archaeon]|nr:hypothetical protein [Thermoplasmata archaeon]